MVSDVSGLVTDIGIPVATFLGGFFLSQYDKLRESRRQLRNMRSILFKELSDNYKALAGLWSPTDSIVEVASDGRRVQMLAIRCQELSSEVYHQYLGKMDSLSSVELDRVFIAYKFIQSAKRSGDSFSDQVARGEQTGDYSKARESAAGIIFSADNALDKMTSALEAFPGRNKEAAELKATLGSELPRLKEVGDAIETVFDDPGRDNAGS